MEVRDHREPGWLWADNEIVDSYGPKIGAYGIAVYMVLARHAGPSGTAWPSLRRIATLTKLSRNSVLRALDCLQEHGLISVDKRTTDDGDQDTNLYTMLRVKGGGSPHELPSSPHEPGVVHHVNQGGSPREPEEDTVNKTQEKEKEEGKAPTANPAFEAFMQARGGAVNAMDSEQLHDLESLYGTQSVVQAIQWCNQYRDRPFLSIAYIGKTLAGWQRDGKLTAEGMPTNGRPKQKRRREYNEHNELVTVEVEQ